MTAQLIEARVADIIVRDRLRKVLPRRVEALRPSIRANGVMAPLELVDTDEGMRLIYGAHRLAAASAELLETVPALLHPKGTFGSEDRIREREIAENFQRFELNALERAINIAEWRAVHERANPPPKRGRKPESQKGRKAGDELLDELGATFALNFTDTVQQVLGLSRRAVFLALKVATIEAKVRDAIATHPIANKQTELLALAEEPVERQVMLAHLILAKAADSVADAIATLDNLPPETPVSPSARLSDAFSRLKPVEQSRFFDLHAEAIERWLAERRERAGK